MRCDARGYFLGEYKPHSKQLFSHSDPLIEGSRLVTLPVMVTPKDEGFNVIKRRLGHVRHLNKEMKTLMADLDQAIADLTSAVQAAASRVITDIQALKDQITALEGQVPANLVADIQAIEDQVTALANIDPATPPPAP